jgi:hypothetical protein
MWLRGVERLDHDIVCDDVRFIQEYDAIRELGGVVLRIRREGAGDRINPGHASEQIHRVPYDFVLVNNGTEADLAEDLGQIVAKLRLPEQVSA